MGMYNLQERAEAKRNIAKAYEEILNKDIVLNRIENMDSDSKKKLKRKLEELK